MLEHSGRFENAECGDDSSLGMMSVILADSRGWENRVYGESVYTE